MKPIRPANEELGLERIVFFSDAVMAIAITLLAIDLKYFRYIQRYDSGLIVASLWFPGPCSGGRNHEPSF